MSRVKVAMGHPAAGSSVSGDDSPAGLEDIQSLDPELLRRRWRSVTGRPAPPRLSANLMIRILVWREQIARTGDLDPATRGALDAARDGRDAAPANLAGTSAGHRLRPGTVLVREHQGVLHRVMALEKGFAWNGGTYGSLSEVARVITRTNWNGNRFFGVGNGARTSKRESSTSGGPA